MWPDLRPLPYWWQGVPLPFALVWGLAVFLLGVRLLAYSLESVAGGQAERLLRRLAATAGRAFLLGALAAGLLHSSGVTAASSIALVHAGILTDSQGFAVILGANIGTTFTAQLAAFSWAFLIGPLILAGAVLLAAGTMMHRPSFVGAGGALVGLGGLFWGIEAMSAVAGAWAAQPHAVATISRFAVSPWTSALLGMTVAALLQSSTATVGLAMIAHAQGLVPLPAAVAVVLGANIGSSTQGLLASLGTEARSRRTAVADFLFNLSGVLLVLPWIGSLAPLLCRLSESPERQVAHAHTFFNVFTATLALHWKRYLLQSAGWLVARWDGRQTARWRRTGRRLVIGGE